VANQKQVKEMELSDDDDDDDIVNRDFEGAHNKLFHHYFGDNPFYSERMFERNISAVCTLNHLPYQYRNMLMYFYSSQVVARVAFHDYLVRMNNQPGDE
jgi:hypothetical protein